MILSAFLARHRWSFAAALLVAGVYATSLSILPKHVFWVLDEGAKFFELESCSLSWQDRITYRIPFAGQRLLPDNEFLPDFGVYPAPRTVNGKLYLEFDSPFAFPLLTAPLYHAFGTVGLYILPVASGWLIALLSGLMASRFDPLLGPFAVLLVGLGTPVWFYSMLFWEHTLATLLGLIAVGLLVRAPRRVESLALLVPVIVLACIFRIEVAVLGPALVVAWVVVGVNAMRRPAAATNDAGDGRLQPPSGRWLLILLSLGSTAAVAAVLNVFLIARHRRTIRFLPYLIDQDFTAGMVNVPKALAAVFIHSEKLGPSTSVAWSTEAIVAVLLTLVAPLIGSARARAVMVVAAASLMLTCCMSLIITGEPYRALHGLFPVAPFLIVWPLALRHMWRRRNASLLALGTTSWVYLLLGFVALELTYIHSGVMVVGMEWGQRYLLTAYPMLTVLALVGIRALATSSAPAGLRTASVTLFALLAAAGVCLELRGQRMLYGTRSLMAQWDQAMRSEGPVVTTIPWLAPTVADLFVTHDMFFARPPAVARWVELARQHGIAGFTLAEEEPLTDEELGVLGVPWLHRAPEGTRTVTGGLHLTRFQIDPVPSQ
jgi:hypothetical protein